MLNTVLINVISNACYEAIKYSISSFSSFIKDKCAEKNIEISEEKSIQIGNLVSEKFNKESSLEEIKDFISGLDIIKNLSNIKNDKSIVVSQKNLNGDNNSNISVSY